MIGRFLILIHSNSPHLNTKKIAQHKIHIISDWLILHNVVILINEMLV